MIKKILNFTILLIIFFTCISNVKADEITSFDFMDKGNNSFLIGANNYVSGNFAISVEDSTQIKPYINLLIATTGYPDFIITENDHFSNTVIKKLYSSGTANIDGYSADLYVVQFATRGIGWNCSSSGLNCYINTQLRLNNTYSYNSGYQLQSIALTDTVLTDDYLSNMQINQNNQIIEQGKETNEKLDNLDETIKDSNQQLQDSIIDSNKETQEVIKDQFNNCRDSYNLLNVSSSYSVTGFNNVPISLKPGTYTISWSNIETNGSNSSLLLFFQTDNGQKAVYIDNSYLSKKFTFSTSVDINSVYIYSQNNFVNSESVTTTFTNLMINDGSIAKEYEPYGEELCSNKIDETNDKLDDLNSSLTDSSSTDMSGLGDSAGWLPPGPVDSILTLPLTMLNSLVTNLTNNSCQTATLKLPFVNVDMPLPCVKSLYDKMGVTGTLFTTAGLIASAFILFNYLLKLYKWVDDTLTMRENTMPGYFEDNWGGGA